MEKWQFFASKKFAANQMRVFKKNQLRIRQKKRCGLFRCEFLRKFICSFFRKKMRIFKVAIQLYGFEGSVSQWIQSFLSDGTQCVSIDGTSSRFFLVKHRVPQGSISLYTLFTNELPEVVYDHLQMPVIQCVFASNLIGLWRRRGSSKDPCQPASHIM